MLGNAQTQASINTAFPIAIDFLDQENAFNQNDVFNQGSVLSQASMAIEGELGLKQEDNQRQSLVTSSTFSDTNSQETTSVERKVVVAENNTYYLQEFAPNTYWFVSK